MAQIHYIDLSLTEAQSAVGVNAGTDVNPWNYWQFYEQIKSSIGNRQSETIYKMKGSIAYYQSAFSNDNWFSVGSSSGGVSATLHRIVPWDLDLYGPWMIKVIDGFKTQGCRLSWEQGWFEAAYIRETGQYTWNTLTHPDYYNSWKGCRITLNDVGLYYTDAGVGVMYYIDGGTAVNVKFFGCTIQIPKGRSFSLGTDARPYFENCIFDVYNVFSLYPGIEETWFTFDNVALPTTISALSASNILSGGNISGKLLIHSNDIVNNFSTSSVTSAFTWTSCSATPLSACRTYFNYLREEYNPLSAIGDPIDAATYGYDYKSTYSNYRDGVGALYFERIDLNLSASPSATGVLPPDFSATFYINDTSANKAANKNLYVNGVYFDTISANNLSAASPYIFDDRGTYNISAAASSYRGWHTESDSLVVNILGYPNPRISFIFLNPATSASITSANQNDIVALSASGRYISTFNYDYGDYFTTSGISISSNIPIQYHIWQQPGLIPTVLTVYNEIGVSTTTSANLAVSAYPQSVYYVNISNLYESLTSASSHAGTSADPFNWLELETSASRNSTQYYGFRNNDLIRLYGTRRVSGIGRNGEPYVFETSLLKSYNFDSWGMSGTSALTPWMIICENTVSAGKPAPATLRFDGDTLKNGIIYNKPIYYNNKYYGPELVVTNIYDMYINHNGIPYYSNQEGFSIYPKQLSAAATTGRLTLVTNGTTSYYISDTVLIESPTSAVLYAAADPCYLIRNRFDIGTETWAGWEFVASAAASASTVPINKVYEIKYFNGNIFVCTGIVTGHGNDRLLRWNLTSGTNLFEYAGSANNEAIHCIGVHNNELYAGTRRYADLYKWDGNRTLILCATPPNEGVATERELHSIISHNGRLYASTAYKGRLFEYDEVNHTLNIVAEQLNDQKIIYDIVVFNGKIYAGTTNDIVSTQQSGRLFEFRDYIHYPSYNTVDTSLFNIINGHSPVWSAAPSATTYYVNINDSYATSGHSGTSADPYNFTDFYNRVKPLGTGLYSDTYSISGTKNLSAASFSPYVEIFKFTKLTSWGLEPWRIYSDDWSFRILSYAGTSAAASATIENAILFNDAGYIQIGNQNDGTHHVTFNNCYIDTVQFYNFGYKTHYNKCVIHADSNIFNNLTSALSVNFNNSSFMSTELLADSPSFISATTNIYNTYCRMALPDMYGVVNDLGSNTFGYNDTSSYWVQVANSYQNNQSITDLFVYDNELYAGTRDTEVGSFPHVGGSLLKWNGSNSWQKAAAPYSISDTSKAMIEVSAINRLYVISTYANSYLTEFRDIAYPKSVNIKGCTLYINDGIYDNNFSENYNLSVFDSVLIGFSAINNNLSAANATFHCNAFNADDHSTNLIIDESSLNQYYWEPPTDYPFWIGSTTYNKDTDWLYEYRNKYVLIPFSGLDTPPWPGFYSPEYVDFFGINYDRGLFTDVRTGIGAFYFGPIDTTISAGPYYLHIYANSIASENVIVSGVGNLVSLRMKLVYGTVINTSTDLDIDFIGVPQYGTSPLVVQFTDLTTINTPGFKIKTRTWDFGDGTPNLTTTQQVINHVYVGYAYQKFQVKLTVEVEPI